MNVTPQAATAVPDVVYILDTNVLVTFLESSKNVRVGDGHDRRSQEPVKHAVAWILKNACVYIPHITLVEIAGLLFQQRIDLAQYDQWHRHRKIAFDHIVAMIFNRNRDVRLHTAPTRLEAINPVVSVLSAPLRARIADHLDRRRPEHRGAREPKALDGVDAQIVDEANVIAGGFPATHCWLVTADKGLQWWLEDSRTASRESSFLAPNLHPLSSRDLVSQVKGCNLQGGPR
jgi:hypothetical protein